MKHISNNNNNNFAHIVARIIILDSLEVKSKIIEKEMDNLNDSIGKPQISKENKRI